MELTRMVLMRHPYSAANIQGFRTNPATMDDQVGVCATSVEGSLQCESSGVVVMLKCIAIWELDAQKWACSALGLLLRVLLGSEAE